MRILADENFPLETIRALERAGHDVEWVRDQYPGAKDRELLERAEADSRVLITLDKDFRQITMQRRAPLLSAGVILFQVHPATPGNLTPLVLRSMAAGYQWVGHMSVVTADRVLSLLLGSREA